MKKILLAAAIAAFVMAGCSKNDPVDQLSTNSIQFKTLEVGSRAAEKGLSTLQSDGFTAFAYYSSEQNPSSTADYTSQYMAATSVSYSAPDWTYSPLKFWPTDGKNLVFYAYDNVITIGDISAHGTTPASYTAPEAEGAGIDALVAKTDAINTPTQKVVMNFHHALSQIVVSARVPDALQSLEFKITGIRLTNLKPSGNVNLLTWNPATPDAGNNAGNGLAWTATGNAETDYVLGLAASAEAIQWISGGAYTDITSTTGGLFVIPQQLDPGDALRYTATQNEYDGTNAGAYLEVTYQAKDILSGELVQNTTTAVPLSQNFQPGLKYRVNLTLIGSGKYGPTDPDKNPDGVDNIMPILFDADVVEWVVSPLDMDL